jgi:hypothetical protein
MDAESDETSCNAPHTAPEEKPRQIGKRFRTKLMRSESDENTQTGASERTRNATRALTIARKNSACALQVDSASVDDRNMQNTIPALRAYSAEHSSSVGHRHAQIMTTTVSIHSE